MHTIRTSWWFVFYKDQLLLEKKEDGSYTVPCREEAPFTCTENTGIHEVTIIDGIPCKAFSASTPIETGNQYVTMSLRDTYSHIPPPHFSAAGKAAQILHWDKHSRFCSVCGTPPEQIAPIFKRCPLCGEKFYPCITTAILALVRKEDTILLVHAHNFKGNFQSLVAGFLETGETLEECVHREVLEETGLKIKNLTYFGNQSWPYPSGLMVGFTADYESGEIKLQSEELSCGAFYTKDNMPEVPGKLSLAGKMIDHWLQQE